MMGIQLKGRFSQDGADVIGKRIATAALVMAWGISISMVIHAARWW